MTRAGVSLDNGLLKVHCELTNHSSEAWAAEAGWAIGYQLFDDPTGTLVIDGPRTPLNLSPSQSAAFDLEIPVPPEPGEYNICVSPVQEHVAWSHEKGGPFLLIEASVSDAG